MPRRKYAADAGLAEGWKAPLGGSLASGLILLHGPALQPGAQADELRGASVGRQGELPTGQGGAPGYQTPLGYQFDRWPTAGIGVAGPARRQGEDEQRQARQMTADQVQLALRSSSLNPITAHFASPSVLRTKYIRKA